MRAETKIGALLSLLIHLSIAGIGVLYAWIAPKLDKESEVIIMELVSFPDDVSVTMEENQVVENTREPLFEIEEQVDQDLPEIREVAPLEKLEVPPEPQPAEPQPSSVTPPRPEPPRPQPEPRPQPRPQPRPEPIKPEIVSIDDFRKQHGEPRKQPTRPQPSRTVVPPTVSSSDIRVHVPQISSSGRTQFSNAPQVKTGSVAQENYLNRIRRILDSSWLRPRHLPKGLSVDVEFRVDSSGNITLLRFLRNSGNPEFDDTVRKAFQDAARAPAPPQGQALVSQVGFRLD